MVKEDYGILNRQSLLSVFPRLHKALDICIRKGQNMEFVKYYTLVLNKICNDDRMLTKQRRLFSRKCTVKIHEVMVNNAKKNYLTLHFLTRSSGESGFEQ